MITETKDGTNSKQYFQFKLSALRASETPDDWKEEKKEQIKTRIFGDTYRRLTKSYDEKDLAGEAHECKATAIAERISIEFDFEINTETDVRIANAASQLDQTPQNIENYIKKATSDTDFAESKVLVQTPWDLTREAFCEGRIPTRDFAVYCAIKSVLGRNRVGRVTVRQIQARAAGYERPTDAEAAGANLLSKHQIATSISRLEKKNLIQKYTVKSRFSYFGMGKLPDVEFIPMVANLVQRSQSKTKATADKKTCRDKLFESFTLDQQPKATPKRKKAKASPTNTKTAQVATKPFFPSHNGTDTDNTRFRSRDQTVKQSPSNGIRNSSPEEKDWAAARANNCQTLLDAEKTRLLNDASEERSNRLPVRASQLLREMKHVPELNAEHVPELNAEHVPEL